MGNIEAVNDWPQPKYRSKEAAMETYLYASFDSDISGKAPLASLTQ